MIDRVVFCPAAPFLISGIAAMPPDATAVLASCLEATGTLRGVDRVIVLSEATGRGVQTFGPGTPVGTAGLVRSDLAEPAVVRLPGPFEPESVPAPGGGPAVGTAVGGHLLQAARVLASSWAIELPPDADYGDSDVSPRLAELIGSPDDDSITVGLLALCDGATSHSAGAPLGVHPAAADVDAAFAAAIATGSPGELGGWLARDGELADAAGVRGRAVLEAIGEFVPGAMHARVLLQAAPFGVGYLVATWGHGG